MFTIDDTVDATTPYTAPSGGAAKLAQAEQPYGGYPQYAQTMYQEPNMAEVGYGGAAAPLLSPFGSDGQQSRHNSMQSGGPFSDGRQGSGPWPGSEGSYGRQSLSAGAGYASGAGSGYGMAPHSGYASGAPTEKSVPAHQRSHRVEHEMDAGGLPMPAEDVERLPPTYNPHWLEARAPEAGSSSVPAGAAPAAVGDSKSPAHPAPQPSASGERGLPSVPGSSEPGMFQPPAEKH